MPSVVVHGAEEESDANEPGIHPLLRKPPRIQLERLLQSSERIKKDFEKALLAGICIPHRNVV